MTRSLILLALLAACSHAHAQWPSAGVPLCASGCAAADLFSLVPDGGGGAFILWRQGNYGAGTADDVYLQRVTLDGAIAPGWPANGLAICAQPFNQLPYQLIPDGSGGVIALWDDRRTPGIPPDLYAQRVNGDGTLAPGWPVNGARICDGPGTESEPGMVTDGQGGMFVAWGDDRIERDLYAQHILGDGTRAPGWPSDGLPICTLPGTQGGPVEVVADAAGGFFAIWFDGRRGGFPRIDIYAQRRDAAGTLAPGWNADGNLVMTSRRMIGQRAAASDEMGGFIVAAAQIDSVSFYPTYWAQRMLGTGAVAPGWPVDGLPVCDLPGFRDGLFGAPDGSGGLLLSWYDSEIRATRFDASGLAVGWTPQGTRVSDPNSLCCEFEGVIAPDGVGGAFVVWQRESSEGRPSIVQHLDAGGARAPGWPVSGFRVSTTPGQYDTRIGSDGLGGAIVAWRGPGPDGVNGAFVQRFRPDGPTAVLVSLTGLEADPDRVELVWQGAGVVGPSSVERRQAHDDWRDLGAPVPDGGDRWRYEDRSVVAGERYAYRLRYVHQGTTRHTDDTWVDVPSAYVLTLRGFVPNPAVGAPTVAFTLARSGPASLELLDVAGRRMASHEVGSLGPGSHAIRFGGGPALAPGVYLVRLRTPDRALVTRAAILR